MYLSVCIFLTKRESQRGKIYTRRVRMHTQKVSDTRDTDIKSLSKIKEARYPLSLGCRV